MKNFIFKFIFFSFLTFSTFNLNTLGNLSNSSNLLYAAEPFCVDPFPDVSCEGEIYSKAIEFLSEENIVEGYPDGNFRPNQAVNRAEMTKIIVEGLVTLGEVSSAEVEKFSTQECFSDVPANQWYTKYVCYGKAQNWLIGYDEGTNENGEIIRAFKPSQTVNFVEALKITMKGFDYQFSEGNIWYENSVRLAAQDNLIPFSITEFGENMARNEMADLVARVVNSQEGALENFLGERADLNVTYETIEAGIDVSKLNVGTISP